MAGESAGSTGASSGPGYYAAATMGLDLLGGLLGYYTSQMAADAAESRGRMLMLEAEADATRYAEQARSFKATQKLAYLKSGVKLSGSPLDVLDETARIAEENLSAIRARGRAEGLDARDQAEGFRAAGRFALVKGLAGAAGTYAKVRSQAKSTEAVSKGNRENTPYDYRGLLDLGY